jgi:hypothetical protein
MQRGQCNGSAFCVISGGVRVEICDLAAGVMMALFGCGNPG